jgi:hypothetical protein
LGLNPWSYGWLYVALSLITQSEQIFSTASLLFSKFRNRMEPDLAGGMIFIKKHFEWYEEFLLKPSEEE